LFFSSSVPSASPEGEHLPPIFERRILIADDERVIADTLAAILGQVGFSTRAVYSGETALEIAEFYLPDMFISDVVPRQNCDLLLNQSNEE
jgi:DNA-binding response OmpR family regulator